MIRAVAALALFVARVSGFATPIPPTCDKSYIVVGAGGAGAPMAYGLASAGCKVTVIEKGPDDDWTGPWFGMPDAYPLWVWELSWIAAQNVLNYEIGSAFFSVETWEYDRNDNLLFTTCETYCKGGPKPATDADLKKSWTYTANIVGGNTAHNLGFWLRGDCSVYEQFGADWSCAATTESMEEMEAMYASLSGTSYGDMMNSEKSGYLTQADASAKQGLEAAGFTMVRGREVGAKGNAKTYGYTEWTTAATGSEWFPGEPARITSGKAFIDPIRKKEGFTLITRAWAEKLVYDSTDPLKVVGLQYMDMTTNQKKAVFADEVILTLGGLMTPQLLLVSGIGPKADLEALGISVVKDLPVGTTYQNHVWAPGMFCKKPETVAPLNPGKSTDTFKVKPGWTGVETPFPKTNGNLFAMGTSTVGKDDGVADYAFAILNNIQGGPLAAAINCTMLADMNPAWAKYSSPTMAVTGVMQSKSRGSLKIKSASMHDDPIYDPNFLDHPDDLAVITEAYQALRSVLTPELGYLPFAPEPGTEAGFAKMAACTFWHDSSTTPIGKVVDEKLKVYGIKGLRVADTSVQPLISNTPTSPVAQVGLT